MSSLLEEKPHWGIPLEEAGIDLKSDEPGELRLTVIEPTSNWRLVDWGELWHYHELLYFLIWRDIRVRYKQTVLGAAWAILQPLATMVVFSMFLGRVAAASAPRWPYPLFVFAGLLPWTFLANAISTASQSIVGSQSLVTKVYFPRLMIPMGAIGAGLVDFLIAFVMLFVLMAYYGVAPGWGMLLAPLILVGLLIVALGVGVLLAALTVAYRDFRYVVPFMVQLWMFATPSIYLQTEAYAHSRWVGLLAFNPAYGLIANFRLAILGGKMDLPSLAISGTVSLALVAIGCLYFRRVERYFADII
jgi:lipopolysaccharide transport system permease protein